MIGRQFFRAPDGPRRGVGRRRGGLVKIGHIVSQIVSAPLVSGRFGRIPDGRALRKTCKLHARLRVGGVSCQELMKNQFDGLDSRG
jgi:hypothetical protein